MKLHGPIVLIGLVAFASTGRAQGGGPDFVDELSNPNRVNADWFRARSAFATVDAKLWPRLDKPTLCGLSLGDQFQEVRVEYPRLVEQYRALRRFDADEWAVAALDRIATLEELTDRRVEEMKQCPPPGEVVKLGSEACALYRQKLAEAVDRLLKRSPADQARNNYALACQMARDRSIDSPFARHACSHVPPLIDDAPSKAHPAPLPPPPPFQVPKTLRL